MPMGVDNVVFGFDMKVQPLVTHNASSPLCSVRAYGMCAICIDVISYLLICHQHYWHRCREWSKAIRMQVVSAVCIDVVSSHMKYCRIAYSITR